MAEGIAHSEVGGIMDELDIERGLSIMKPRDGACQVCGHHPAHAADLPHNAGSMYYQYAFHAEHGRWPTWVDAMAHCTPEVREDWEGRLRDAGLWTE